jgi:hypothetical protein
MWEWQADSAKSAVTTVKKWRISAVFRDCECYAAARSSAIMDRANGMHWPHFAWHPTLRYAWHAVVAPDRAASRT